MKNYTISVLLLCFSTAAMDAGSSLKQCKGLNPSNCWAEVDGSSFNVRHHFERKKIIKQASQAALLNLVAVDFLQTAQKIDDFGNHVSSLPSADRNLFIVNIQLPSKASGGGYQLVVYFAIPDWVQAEMDGDDHMISSPQIRLLRDFIADKDGIRERFKVIGRLQNLNDLELKGMDSFKRPVWNALNSKPLISAPEQRFNAGDRYFEIEIDVHEWRSLTRNTVMHFVDNYFQQLIIEIGFVIEAQSEEELPEQILGAVQIQTPENAPDNP